MNHKYKHRIKHITKVMQNIKSNIANSHNVFKYLNINNN